MNNNEFTPSGRADITCMGLAGSFSVWGAVTTYLIIDQASSCTYSSNRSLQQARNAIDLLGSRWQLA